MESSPATAPPTTPTGDSVCPGCGARLPADPSAVYDGYFNTSPECWHVFERVLAAEFSDVVLFRQVHQLTVDAYAVQHAGGPHPDKSVCIHLAGLYLALDRGVPVPKVARLLQRIAARCDRWPHFEPPPDNGPLMAADVARAGDPSAHADVATAWARQVWAAWAFCHDEVAALVGERLG